MDTPPPGLAHLANGSESTSSSHDVGYIDSETARRGLRLPTKARPYRDFTKSRSDWNGRIQKFVPIVVQHGVDSVGLAQNPRELKSKLFVANGYYDKISKDIKTWYQLTDAELKHVLSQLGRLLWGESTIEAGDKIDAFHMWKLDLVYYKSQIADPRPPMDFHDANIREMVDLTTDNPSLFESFWNRLDYTNRRLLWPQMVGCAMTMRPPPLCALVKRTFNTKTCSNYILEDIVHFLNEYSRIWDPPSLAGAPNDALQIAEFLGRHAPYRYIQLPQSSLLQVWHRLDQTQTPNRLWEYYAGAREKGQWFTHQTLLQVASRLAKLPEQKGRALEVFRHLKELPSFDINAPEAQSVCTTLLSVQKNGPLPGDDASPENIFETLVDMGFNPNLIGWSALMHNFCLRGHLDTGWKVFDLMCQRGIKPDGMALSILMNRSKLDHSTSSARNVLRVAMASNSWSPGLLNNFLETLFYANEDQILKGRRQRKTNSAWRPMVQLYSKFFHLEPLQQLTMFPLENILLSRGAMRGHDTELTDMAASIKPLRDSELMQPDVHTLMLMFTAHLRSIHHPAALRSYYRLFQRQQAQQDPPSHFVRMIQTFGTRVHDMFLQAFMQFRSTVPFALDIVSKMYRRSTMPSKDESDSWKYLAPSVHTWTIVMNGFKNHHEATDAMRILDLMTRVGGLQPAQPTWNILLAAYAKQSDLPIVVDIVGCLEAAGYGTSERTLESFRFLKTSQRAEIVEMLDARRAELAAAAAVYSFDTKEPSDGRLPAADQQRLIRKLVARALPPHELASNLGRTAQTKGSSEDKLVSATFRRMQQRWEALAATARRRRRMHYKHADALWRRQQAQKHLKAASFRERMLAVKGKPM